MTEDEVRRTQLLWYGRGIADEELAMASRMVETRSVPSKAHDGDQRLVNILRNRMSVCSALLSDIEFVINGFEDVDEETRSDLQRLAIIDEVRDDVVSITLGLCGIGEILVRSDGTSLTRVEDDGTPDGHVLGKADDVPQIGQQIVQCQQAFKAMDTLVPCDDDTPACVRSALRFIKLAFQRVGFCASNYEGLVAICHHLADIITNYDATFTSGNVTLDLSRGYAGWGDFTITSSDIVAEGEFADHMRQAGMLKDDSMFLPFAYMSSVLSDISEAISITDGKTSVVPFEFTCDMEEDGETLVRVKEDTITITDAFDDEYREDGSIVIKGIPMTGFADVIIQMLSAVRHRGLTTPWVAQFFDFFDADDEKASQAVMDEIRRLGIQ